MKKLITILLVLFAVSYTIDTYAQITYKLNESFEGTWLPTGWTSNSVQGSNMWVKSGEIAPLFPPYPNGTNCAAVDYQTTGGDDWLITPQIMNIVSGDSLVFRYVKRYSDGPYPPDSCIVRLSTTTNTPNSAFNKTLLRICLHCIPIGTQTWKYASIPLTPYIGSNVYIAFQHKDVDGHGMGLDVVQVKNNGVSIPVYSNTGYNLNQNYPNPFSKTTMINFNLPKNENVKLTVMDVLGNEIAVLVNQNLTAGSHSVEFNAESLSAGVYFYKLESGDYKETKVMMLDK